MSELENYQKRTLNTYQHLNVNAQKGKTVFTGSSLMEFFPINEIIQKYHVDKIIYNRGICGYISQQLLDAIDTCILDLEPSELFINIGTNDVSANLFDELFVNYQTIIDRVKQSVPDCQITIMAFYPCNDVDDFGLDEKQHAGYFTYRTPDTICEMNEKLSVFAKKNGCAYIDVNDGLYDENGRLKKELSIDGVHMYPEGYEIVMKNLLPYLR